MLKTDRKQKTRSLWFPRWVPMIFTSNEDVITSVFSFLRVLRAKANAVGARAHTVAKFVQV